MDRRSKALVLVTLLIVCSVQLIILINIAASPTTLTLRPNAAGTYQQWSLTDSTHWGATSDQNDATYVYVYGSTTLKETENLQNTTQTGTINSVTAYMRAKAIGSSAGEKATLIWKLGATEVEPGGVTIDRTTFTNYSNNRTTDPAGGSWEWSDIDSLEIGSRATTLGATETIQVSEYWIVVDYTPAAVRDVAILSVTPSPTNVNPGRVVNITVVAENQGTATETFNVTAKYDNTTIEAKTVSNLASGANTTLTFSWNTTGVAEGTYTIKAVADVLSGETDTADNTYIDGTVTIVKPTVSVSPASIIGPPPSINGTFTVNITVSDVVDLYCWQAGMTFNASVLEALSIAEGEFLKRANVTTLWAPGTINNTIGKIAYSGCSLTGPGPGVNGSGQLMNATFKVKDYGNSTLHLIDVILLDSKLIEIPRKPDIDGYFQLPPLPNQPPVLDPIGPKSVNELELLTFTATATDPDIPPQTLTFSLGVGAPSGASINSTTGVFTWTPTEAQGPGNYTIRIKVSDGTLEDYEDILVTVNEVNVAPVLDPIGPKSINELELLTFTATASDSDIPAQTLTFSLGVGAPSGASINATSGVFTWTPTEAQGPGNYTIRIIVSDGALEDYEDIIVTVYEVNLPPVLDPIGNKTIDELNLLTFTATASDPDLPAQTLTFSLGPGAPEGASINSTTGVFTWTPTEAQGPGVYPIRIIVSDGTLEDYEDIWVTVNDVNNPPVLDPIGPKTVNEQQLLTFTATASDPDLPPQTLTFSLGPGAPEGVSINATTGVFTWTPTEAQGPGNYTIRVIVSDGSLEDYEDVLVTVNEVNLAPVLDPIGAKSVNELELLTFTATASDPDLPPQTLTFSFGPGAPEGASINATTGVFTWTPTEAQGPGNYTIRIIVSDGSLTDYEDIWVTVNEVNAPPVLDTIGPKSVDELALLTFTATASDPDIPGQTLTFSLGAGAPAGASINATSGVFTWTPTEAQGPGNYTIRVIVSDGTLEDYEDVSVTVNEVNVAPILDPIGPKSVNELELLTFTATATDPDIPPQTLTFSLGVGAPSGASINSTTGLFTWTPTEAQGPGNYTIRIKVSDGALEDYEDIIVTVYEVNLPPVLDPIGNKTVDELTLLTFTATASDPDLPPQTLTFSLGAGAPEGASINSTTGVFTWTPTEEQGPGVYTIRIIVSDGALEDYEDIWVTVNEVVEVHDVAVLSVVPSATEAYPTWTNPLNVTVVVENQGNATETFNVTCYYNLTAIETKEITLLPGENATLMFNWNVTGIAEGIYTIRAEASVVPGEIETADNTLTSDLTVKLKHPGDANDDGIVNAYDLGMLGKAWGTTRGEPLYNPSVDFNGDGVIDDSDHAIIQEYWP